MCGCRCQGSWEEGDSLDRLEYLRWDQKLSK